MADTTEIFMNLIEDIKSHINIEFIKTNGLQCYLSFKNDNPPSTKEGLEKINASYIQFLQTPEGSFVRVSDVMEIAINSVNHELGFFLKKESGLKVLGEIVAQLETTLLNFRLEQEGFLKISTLQDFLMDYRNQRNTAYCDSEFFNNARKSFNDVPDNLQGYPSKNDINEFCKTAYLNHFKELNPFDSDADLSTEEFKFIFGDLTGYIQSQNEKEMINKSIQGSETPTRKRRL